LTNATQRLAPAQPHVEARHGAPANVPAAVVREGAALLDLLCRQAAQAPMAQMNKLEAALEMYCRFRLAIDAGTSLTADEQDVYQSLHSHILAHDLEEYIDEIMNDESIPEIPFDSPVLRSWEEQ
jgi:hypothetical protein